MVLALGAGLTLFFFLSGMFFPGTMKRREWSERLIFRAGKMLLPARCYSRQDDIAGEMLLPARWYCRQDAIAGKMTLPAR